MDKKTFAPVVFSVALLGSCSDSGPSMLEVAEEAKTEFLAEYDCENPDMEISTVEDGAEFELESANPEIEFILDAATTPEGDIILNEDLLEDGAVRTVTLHEMVHACKLFDEGTNYETPYKTSYDESISIVGANGLNPKFFSTNHPELSGNNPLIEEGLAEWIAYDFGDFYTTDNQDSYAPVRNATIMLSQLAGFTKDDMLEFRANDDLLGFVGLIYSKPATEVTGDELYSVISLYQKSMDLGEAPPTLEALEAHLQVQ